MADIPELKPPVIDQLLIGTRCFCPVVFIANQIAELLLAQRKHLTPNFFVERYAACPNAAPITQAKSPEIDPFPSARGIKNPIWWQSTVTSAGNLTSVIYRAFGQSFSKEDKRLLNVPFAQFVKLNTEFRHLWNMDKNNKIASRVALGALFAYGNATIAPYSEQFYVGGANSIRAFTVRSIGPGGYHPAESRYSYLDQTGTFRFEANVEYRFRIFKSIWGATFLDAGNVWLMRKDEARPNSQLELKTFPKQIALGTGVGIRYDMDILVFRLDFGIPLHLPYDTERSGYYNVTGSFMKNLGIHFAIGYPF